MGIASSAGRCDGWCGSTRRSSWRMSWSKLMIIGILRSAPNITWLSEGETSPKPVAQIAQSSKRADVKLRKVVSWRLFELSRCAKKRK